MIKFKNLFRLKQREIKNAFEQAKQTNKISGIKLLQTSIQNISHGKLLIVIPKTTGKATVRNLLRRRIKSIFYEEELYEKPAISILLVYKNAANLEFEELKNFLMDGFGKGYT